MSLYLDPIHSQVTKLDEEDKGEDYDELKRNTAQVVLIERLRK